MNPKQRRRKRNISFLIENYKTFEVSLLYYKTEEIRAFLNLLLKRKAFDFHIQKNVLDKC